MTWWVAQHLVAVAILVAVVHLVSALFKVGPVLRHALWVVVLLKLITPPLVVWPWAVPIVVGSSRVVATGAGQVIPDLKDDTARTSRAAMPDTIARPSPSRATAISSDVPRMRWQTGALLVWLMGTLVAAAIQIVRIRRMHHLVRAAAPAPSALVAAVDATADRMGLGPIPVRTSVAVNSPFIWTLGRPVLIWPRTMTAAGESEGTTALVAHELAHVARRDHWVGWLEVVATCVWWWNPLVWHVRSELRETAELACDAWATALVPQGRRALADALVTLSATPDARAPALSLHVIGQRRHLQRRLVMIMQSRIPLRVSRFALLLLAVTGSLTLPAWAQRGPDTPASPATVVAPRPLPAPAPSAVPQAVQLVRPSAPAPAESTRPNPARVDQSEPLPATDLERTFQAVAGRIAEVRVAAERQAQRATAQAAEAEQQVERAVAQAAQFGGTQAPFAFISELPQEAQVLLDRFEQSSERMREELEAKITAERTAVIAELQKLQDGQARAGNLDEAIAIRDRIRALQNGPWTAYGPFRYKLQPNRLVPVAPSPPRNPEP